VGPPVTARHASNALRFALPQASGSATMLARSDEGATVASILNPYLNFQGTAREAMTFYQEVLGGELVLNTFGDNGAQDAPFADQIMHGQLETPQGWTLMASDMPPGMDLTPGNNLTVSLSGDDDELRVVFERLSVDGTITVPLAQQMWGAEFGQFTDKFGTQWMVNISPAGQS
jgi:PhnB protein